MVSEDQEGPQVPQVPQVLKDQAVSILQAKFDKDQLNNVSLFTFEIEIEEIV